MSDILSKIKAELKAFEEKKKTFTEELRKEFPTMFKDLFDKSEFIESVGWTQYTPYFNDGDPCEFGVNSGLDYGLIVNGDRLDDMDLVGYTWIASSFFKSKDEYDNLIKKFPQKKPDQKHLNIVKELLKFEEVISYIPEYIMKDLFGDHVKVTIHKNGTVETEYYDHD